ncbi:zinc ribbon domain-containing protein [Persephonella sp.]
MDSDLEVLLQLQEIDQEIKKTEELIEQIPQEIEKLKEKKESLILKFEKTHTDLKRLEALKREKELDIQTYEDRILKIQEALERVKTNEEYKALLREKAQLEEMIMEVEDEILAIMEDIEKLQEEEKKLQQVIDREKEEIDRQIKEKEQYLKNLQEKLGQLKQKREEFIKGVKPPLLSKYELIRKKRGTAVAVVDSDTCTGCYLIIPPKIYSELVSGEKLLTCPHCGRFLFYRPK